MWIVNVKSEPALHRRVLDPTWDKKMTMDGRMDGNIVHSIPAFYLILFLLLLDSKHHFIESTTKTETFSDSYHDDRLVLSWEQWEISRFQVSRLQVCGLQVSKPQVSKPQVSRLQVSGIQVSGLQRTSAAVLSAGDQDLQTQRSESVTASSSAPSQLQSEPEPGATEPNTHTPNISFHLWEEWRNERLWFDEVSHRSEGEEPGHVRFDARGPQQWPWNCFSRRSEVIPTSSLSHKRRPWTGAQASGCAGQKTCCSKVAALKISKGPGGSDSSPLVRTNTEWMHSTTMKITGPVREKAGWHLVLWAFMLLCFPLGTWT